MKLELKHALAYASYNIEAYTDERIVFNNDSYVSGLYSLSIGNISDMLNEGHFDKIKMCLRPLSDLKGMNPKFNPKAIDHPISIVNPKTQIEVEGAIHHGHPNLIGIYITYDQMEKLLEYHFDVFGLIPEGLAIDINTIKNE